MAGFVITAKKGFLPILDLLEELLWYLNLIQRPELPDLGMNGYDHSGCVNRVHPKQINGQDVIFPHYPLTAKELGL